MATTRKHQPADVLPPAADARTDLRQLANRAVVKAYGWAAAADVTISARPNAWHGFDLEVAGRRAEVVRLGAEFEDLDEGFSLAALGPVPSLLCRWSIDFQANVPAALVEAALEQALFAAADLVGARCC